MKETKTSSIASRIDFEKIQYVRATRSRVDKDVVLFATVSKNLYFNPRMVEKLALASVNQVLVGHVKGSKVFVLKIVSVEEFGAVRCSSCQSSRYFTTKIQGKNK